MAIQITTIEQIREAVREEQQELAEHLARRIYDAVANAQPGLFDRDYLPHPAAADYLGISSRQLQKLRQASLVTPTFRDGRMYYYARADLDEYASGGRGCLNHKASDN